MKTSNTDHSSNDGGHEDDDNKQEFDGMDVEDWLVKHHTLAERSQEARERQNDFLDGMDVEDWLVKHHGSAERGQETRERQNDFLMVASTAPVQQKVGSLVEDHDSVLSGPAQHGLLTECNPLNSMMSSNNNISGLDEDQMDEEQAAPWEEVVMNACIRRVETSDRFYIAEVTGTTQNDGLLLVNGVRTMDPKMKKMLQFLCALALASLLAVVAGMITTHLVREPALPADTIGIPLSSSNNSLGEGEKKPVYYIPAETYNYSGDLSLTLSEAIVDAESDGFFPTAMFASTSLREGVLDSLDRTDANYTVFWVAKTGILQIFNKHDISLLSKMLSSDSWNGHVMDWFQSMVVEGAIITLEDLYAGMVMTSLSGYPLKIQFNPLRAKNVSFIIESSNQLYKNGIVHFLSEYPNPLVPWIGKSLFDVLVETSEKRDDDLSDIIDLIQKAPDDIKNLIQLVDAGATSETTLFAPTNAAMAKMNLTMLSLNETSLSTFLEHHIVSSNFARRFWRFMPISANATSDSGLAMTTRGGQVLDVDIDDVTVTINGNVTIVQGDIFSQQGLLHVIDNPLTLFLS